MTIVTNRRRKEVRPGQAPGMRGAGRVSSAVGLWCAAAGLGAAAAAAGIGATAVAAAPLQGDSAHGKTLYQACAACHSIDENDIGPKHRGVVGRPAASIADYAYSAALRTSGLTWDEATLDRWLTNPSALVPGTKMYFKIDDAQSRADIIAYLKEQK
jgi:cytochrome c